MEPKKRLRIIGIHICTASIHQTLLLDFSGVEGGSIWSHWVFKLFKTYSECQINPHLLGGLLGLTHISHYSSMFYMPRNATLRPKKRKELLAFRSSVKAKGIQHIHNICKTETERWRRKKRTHTHMHSSHHHLHSRFLKSSHISVTIATLLCLPVFFVPVFFFF